MSNIKVIFIILINIFLISLSAVKIGSGNNFFILIPLLVGIANDKYLYSNTKLTNKQRFSVKLFIIITVISAIFYIFYFM